VFNTCGAKIYKNEGLRVVGNELHYEERDIVSGMYPLTLMTHDTYICAAATDQTSILLELALVADAVLHKERTRPEGAKVPALDLLDEIPAQRIAALSRLYIREDLSEAERWHLVRSRIYEISEAYGH
jgi:hypothetical protein